MYNVVSRCDQENTVKRLFFRSRDVPTQRTQGCKIGNFQQNRYLFQNSLGFITCLDDEICEVCEINIQGVPWLQEKILFKGVVRNPWSCLLTTLYLSGSPGFLSSSDPHVPYCIHSNTRPGHLPKSFQVARWVLLETLIS